ncbi:MAG: peptide chain release factor N(5)-glutamine methyltransferase [Actinomycetota bacterium]|nr:peptide chain release factor N(5)-glutamine methyltransferase [Actinomycetota bacterium]
MSEPLSAKELLELGERVLDYSDAIFEDHRNDDAARQLLAVSLRVTEDELDELGPAYEPARRQRERYLSLIARRAGGEPLPFLTGRIEFYGLDLKVKPGAFVPRPSSEFIVERAVRRLRRKVDPVVVDMCTGAGPIALAIGDEFPDAEVFGADIDDQALQQGRANARRLDIRNVALKQGDMYDALPNRIRGQVDVLTAHVPYVPREELDDLPAEVRDFEPLHTLTDESADGLGLMRATVIEAPEWLKPGGWLLLEMSDDMAAKAKRLCRTAGFTDIATEHDEYKLSVVVEARNPRR